AAHFLVTRLAPGADPVLLPVAAMLSGLGYAMIYRLDTGRAADQFGWLMLSLLLFAATLFVIRDHRLLDAYTYTIGLAGIFVVMLWTATGRGSYLVLGFVLFAIGAWIGYAAFAHVQDRVTIWLHALGAQHIHTDGYQVAQGEFAMATGGIVGTGLGQGHPG